MRLSLLLLLWVPVVSAQETVVPATTAPETVSPETRPVWSAEQLQQIEEEGIVPLKLGNRWIYRSTKLNSSGRVQERGKYVNQVQGAFLVGNSIWFQLWEFDGVVYARNSSTGQLDGEMEYNTEKASYTLTNTPAAYFRFPVKQGETYQVRPGEETIRIADVDREVRVPAGEFRCIVYESYDQESDTVLDRFFIAPGTGIVRYELQDGSSREIMELTLFVPGTLSIR